MSVKFEKETIRDAPVPGGRREDVAQKMGETLTGGMSQPGYLAVSAISPVTLEAVILTELRNRHTSNNSSRTLSGQRCSPRALFPPYKKLQHPGLQRMLPNMATTSALEYRRWLSTVLSSARHLATS